MGLVFAYAVILGYSTWYSMYLQSIGKIYLGHAEGGFVEITVITFLDILFRTDSRLLLIPVFTFAVLIVAGLYFDLSKKGFRYFLINPVNLFAFLFFGNILVIIFNHWVLGVVYPEERGTFYLFPLFLIALGIAVDFLIAKFKTKKYGLACISVISDTG